MAAGAGAGSSGVRQPCPGYLIHRDLNAAWNLWNVCCAEYGCARRPGYLSAHARCEGLLVTRWKDMPGRAIASPLISMLVSGVRFVHGLSISRPLEPRLRNISAGHRIH